ncbi:MAG: helix-turn-helix domain-containing protein [Bacilli bacterium]
MKNIGLKLKEKRIQNGLSIDEVAEDLKLRPSQIESIEEGKKDDFKDIFYLKYFIRDYAKYLGLDSEKILDEFNEYLFDETSKIPVDLIKEAKKEKNETLSNEKSSPYTKSSKKKINIPKIIIGLGIIIVLIVVGYILVSNYQGNDFSDNNITYSIRR